jgi:hypothetical protein
MEEIVSEKGRKKKKAIVINIENFYKIIRIEIGSGLLLKSN